MREGSAPNYCPPVEEGIAFTLEDEGGELVDLEFLGVILHGDKRYGFFFPLMEEFHVGDSGEVIILEVTELDGNEQPVAFELVEDEAIAQEVFDDFRQATKDLYDFTD